MNDDIYFDLRTLDSPDEQRSQSGFGALTRNYCHGVVDEAMDDLGLNPDEIIINRWWIRRAHMEAIEQAILHNTEIRRIEVTEISRQKTRDTYRGHAPTEQKLRPPNIRVVSSSAIRSHRTYRED